MMLSLNKRTISCARFKSFGFIPRLYKTSKSLNVNLGFAVTILNMDVDWQMLFRIEIEPKSKYKQYCRHSNKS